MWGRSKGLKMSDTWEREIKVIKIMTDACDIPETSLIIFTCDVVMFCWHSTDGKILAQRD